MTDTETEDFVQGRSKLSLGSTNALSPFYCSGPSYAACDVTYTKTDACSPFNFSVHIRAACNVIFTETDACVPFSFSGHFFAACDAVDTETENFEEILNPKP